MRLWEWNEGQRDAPTKTKVAPLRILPAIQHKVFINLHPISVCDWDTKSPKSYSCRQQIVQAHILARLHLHTHANTLDLMRVQKPKRRENNGIFENYPRLLLGVHSGKWCCSFINSDWISSAGPPNHQHRDISSIDPLRCFHKVCPHIPLVDTNLISRRVCLRIKITFKSWIKSCKSWLLNLSEIKS